MFRCKKIRRGYQCTGTIRTGNQKQSHEVLRGRKMMTAFHSDGIKHVGLKVSAIN